MVLGTISHHRSTSVIPCWIKHSQWVLRRSGKSFGSFGVCEAVVRSGTTCPHSTHQWGAAMALQGLWLFQPRNWGNNKSQISRLRGTVWKQSKEAVVLILARTTIMSKGSQWDSKNYRDKLSIFVVRGILCDYCSWLSDLKSRQREELFSLGGSHELQERDL